MAKKLYEETNIQAIANAIREKNGETTTYKTSEMANAISAITTGGGGEYFTDEELTFTDKCSFLFSYDKWKTVLEKEKTRIKIQNPSSLTSLLQGCSGEDYSFLIIEGDGKTANSAGNMLADMPNIKKFPVFKNIVINANQCGSMIYGLKYFTDVNELIKFFDNITFNNNPFQSLNLFSYCYSLRNIDAVMPYLKKALVNYNSGAGYISCFQNMFSLDEINNVPIMNGVKTYNGFNSAFSRLSRAKNITFETDNGTPYLVQWKSQTIDLSWDYGVGTINSGYMSNLVNYNSGITADKEVKDDATYQALKDDPDWFTTKTEYSRYNHDSAVNTINSLPDTSAYLATQGGTNTIKFRGNSGSLTDGGAINTLTEEEIAVAAAKGWTVLFA